MPRTVTDSIRASIFYTKLLNAGDHKTHKLKNRSLYSHDVAKSIAVEMHEPDVPTSELTKPNKLSKVFKEVSSISRI